ncbi:acetylcholinesterase-like [Daktulosphaira vitifoliae]|uniref:acetylcholinesterase-like n=1 Tax=Daktulosphaira vitifoliae TaxID=58002 RepID=UPI0021A9F784|nr:acetylcholinesterase-like [Daktulosphaira vitifoliae]XP_050542831.1 acetylcholinesterase-like [Daktulosphaira vitifoliae]XP_050542832.1 acetylcholinesterase-like [Daktulosphaira vitifoliae]XP_050542833.1 acetylcholinesterase-like [Daktulosphaira vitifoliae]XP_050542834.1 acetylcholinesterase-like [Daktulosphaira vitifoliae]XP_050542835.1 acetylcholinesterase-like [Daktulosphaira vitifoliae]
MRFGSGICTCSTTITFLLCCATVSSRPSTIGVGSNGGGNDGGGGTNGGSGDDGDENPVVATTTGLVRGYTKIIANQEVRVFTGIPFAKPPLGPLRFRRPVPVDPWPGVLNATKMPNTCYQERYEYFPGFEGEEMWNPNTKLSEDCLYLNIWVPRKQRTRHHSNAAHHSKIPVLVWIYGGGYMSGTSTLDIYDGDLMAATFDIMIASMQYRLGAFGSLYLAPELPEDSDDAPGNMGLWDQAMAIRWIKANAEAFGADPDTITLFGESAGGGSVSVHLISPVTRGLVRRGILQSGTVNAPWSYMSGERALEIAKKLLDDCKCNSTDLTINWHSAMSCMRSVDAGTISKKQWNSYSGILGFPSAPTVDGLFMPEHPLDMLKKANFSDIDILIGSNLNEGTYFLLYDFVDFFNRESATQLTKDKFEHIINVIFKDRTQLERDAIIYQYSVWEKRELDDPYSNQKRLGDIVADYFFVCPTNHFANIVADRGARVYYYFFTHRTDSHLWAEWMGVMHGDEMQYVFGHPLNMSMPYNARERDLSIRIMEAFTRFSLTGTPVSDDIEWPLYNESKPIYHVWNAAKLEVGYGPRATECQFWNGFFPKIAESLKEASKNACEDFSELFPNVNDNYTSIQLSAATNQHVFSIICVTLMLIICELF